MVVFNAGIKSLQVKAFPFILSAKNVMGCSALILYARLLEINNVLEEHAANLNAEYNMSAPAIKRSR